MSVLIPSTAPYSLIILSPTPSSLRIGNKEVHNSSAMLFVHEFSIEYFQVTGFVTYVHAALMSILNLIFPSVYYACPANV